MQTGPGLQLWGRTERRKSRPWAVVLFVSYFAMMLSELSMIRFFQGSDGRWVASTADDPGQWWSLIVLTVTLVCFVCAVGFAVTLFRDWRSGLQVPWVRGVTGTDLVYVFAWLQALNTCMLLLYGLYLPHSIFTKGSAGSFLESAYLQMFMLVVIPVWFRGRLEAIGWRAPVQMKRMLLALLLFFLAIVFALDAIVTGPIADWLNLSLESEREQQIQDEIVEAKEADSSSILVSILVIGILVPIAEELLFRGVVQTFLERRWGAFWGILVSSLWFALMHIDLALFAPLFVIGLGLGYLRHRYQSLWGAVLLHAMNNIAGVLYYFY
ncbi:CPBP family intramembrane glutamic endopeptidase [Brevibacillus sp. H7]|jgi:membrane protease YdiL (CAAX protease family)|uniref:CPBP family intramembrane glutamic endopeptidase n=1 Tax=Brevibacillus sp. H7 TaxID=3349138 RepID=UPI00381346A7